MGNTRTNLAAETPESFAVHFETISAMSQWLFWFVVMMSVGAVLVVTYFLGVIDWGLYVSMFSLAAIMIFEGYRDVRFFDSETKLASQQVKILESVHSFEAFLNNAKPSVFKSHLSNLYEIAYTHPDVTQDTLIELLHSRLMARNKVIELFASVLVTLGLIGTIVGLMQMMTQLQIAMLDGSNDPAGLLTRLFQDGGALSGLATAFLTTLIGAALGGVILRVLTSVVDANITRYVAHLAELTEVYVLPTLRRVAKDLESERSAAAQNLQAAQSPAS